ncbi:glycosyltransferase [Roseibium marinum]|uniref:UDP:flavonoid glycosyltransferase YjiC (YdhE family) n=1 Tax=Roseibium marinum TaxID=281252 RepID=A0A2S3UX65_9HYPH|nr:glycosyltransferase [Roseibium marinum]POF32322.1 UDP:flavonoid glycosyltransferase YjiC (YdhE family) [Roseibium marinum]
MTVSRKKILIATLGTRGDVQPYAALGRELSSLGAQVVLSTGEGFEDMIEAAGATARPVPINYQQLLQKPDVKDALFSVKGALKAARKNINLQKDLTRALWTIGLEEQPDLILFNLKAMVMTLVARRLNVPALPTALQPVTAPTGDFPVPLFGLPDFGKIFNRASYSVLRQLMRAGLASTMKPLRAEAETEIAMAGSLIDGYMPGGGKALSLQAFSRALVPTPGDWTDENWQCGYWFSQPDQFYQPPTDLAAFLESGPTPVYLGFGSMPSKDPETLTETVFSALQISGHRAILASGWGGLGKDVLPADLAKRVFLLDKAPHSWLFPRCAAIIHHGGAGTTHEAVRWGKPSLVCPVFADQPFWGARVHDIGAGPVPIPQKKLTPENLAEALRDLENPGYREEAERAAGLMSSEPGARETAARLIETFLRS